MPSINISHLSGPNSAQTPVAYLFLLRTIVLVILVSLLHCFFIVFLKSYSSIRLSSRKCVINSVFSVELPAISAGARYLEAPPNTTVTVRPLV